MIQYNQITNLIAELLFKHDCVIIPNFGGFVARNYSSSFSKGSSLLFPQTKHILFNKNLIHNDGLLISAVMQKIDATSSDATKLVEDYKDYIKSLLSVKKRFELNNIGLLYIDNENNLRFEPKSDVNFLLESFGFEPVIANELLIEPEKPLIVKPFEDRRISTESIPSRKKSYAKIATLAIGLPLALAFILFSAYSEPMKPLLQSSFNPFYTPEKTYTPSNKINQTVFINNIEKSSLLADANGYATFKLTEEGNTYIASLNDTIALVDKTSVIKPVYITTKHSNSFDGKFQVVVGCFGVEGNAEKLVSELQSKKIKAGISGLNNKGLHIVSCGGFNSKKEAVELLASIKLDIPNAWVMSK